MSSYESLPEVLPAPTDDGLADHLVGIELPDLTFLGTDGMRWSFAEFASPTTVIYVYPRSGVPGVPLPEGWDLIPGARGCTPESCGFRDHFGELQKLGADVYGLSSQDHDYQKELAERIELPFPILSDPDLEMKTSLRLPTFIASGMELYCRLTLIIRNRKIVHTFYPIFPPDTHASDVVEWLTQNPA